MIPGASLLLLLLVGLPSPAAVGPRDGGAPLPVDGGRPDAGRADGGGSLALPPPPSAQDELLLRDRELLENLELLQSLEMFEKGPPGPPSEEE